MTEPKFHVTTFNVERRDIAVLYPLSQEVFWRRIELAGQELALSCLGTTLSGGTRVKLEAVCIGRPGQFEGLTIEGCQLSVVGSEGVVVAAGTVSTGGLLALETQALADALALQHNLFRPGEHAATQLQYSLESLPEAPDLSYLLPECDRSVTAKAPLLTVRAAEVIGQLVERAGDAEQRGFSIGVVGPGGVPVVTDVLLPPWAAEGGKAAVEFSPDDWAYALDAVAALGAPFRILGPCHTHPYGMLSPSAVDWDLLLWSVGAEGLAVIAAQVGSQPTAAGYRWIGGSLQRVPLQVEESEPVEAAGSEEVDACHG